MTDVLIVSPFGQKRLLDAIHVNVNVPDELPLLMSLSGSAASSFVFKLSIMSPTMTAMLHNWAALQSLEPTLPTVQLSPSVTSLGAIYQITSSLCEISGVTFKYVSS